MNRLKEKASKLKKEVLAIYYAYQDKNIGFLSRVLILITLGYALSPIDLIPDFIPILGYLDDIIILPILILLVIKLIPNEVMEKARTKAQNEKLQLKRNWKAGLVILMMQLLIVYLIVSKWLF